jgi:uncharacterized integral membrane protein (TIGR00698 family)
MKGFSRPLFFVFAAFALTPWCTPPLALFLGISFALAFGTPFLGLAKKGSKYLLQIAVVGLGFGLDLSAVFRAGTEGFFFTVATISGAIFFGILLGKFLKVERKAALLIAVGTAICGGSAIAAVGPVIHANDDEMSVSLGTVFVLNAVALFLFPLIGHALSMSQNSFGLWAAIAIHDTSSVVGAASAYGAEARAVATTVKLSRALWIIPISLLFAFLERRHEERAETTAKTTKAKIAIPWFIGFFLLASLSRTLIPAIVTMSPTILSVAQALLALTLFLIGAGLSKAVLKKVGFRPMGAGILLWILVGTSTLLGVLATK